ncbi:MAG: hypothetical protein D3916_05835 [Candidatus Electrothrix sp. MAN1_4]|nr:hypothetical protein [Candidatus Electrothrix sp. MAN1_4]
MSKRNVTSWNLRSCDRESGGSNTAQGVCPAAVEQRVDRMHNGLNAGHCCWIITGSVYKNTKQGLYKLRSVACLDCAFYQQTKKEEVSQLKAAVSGLDSMKSESAPA